MNRSVLCLWAAGVVFLTACSGPAVTSTSTPPATVAAASAPSLDWVPLGDFDALSPRLDYDPSELVGIFDCPAAQSAECERVLQYIARLAGLPLLGSYGLDGVAGAVYACGKTLMKFALPPGMSISEGILRLQEAAARVTGRNAIYGVNPRGSSDLNPNGTSNGGRKIAAASGKTYWAYYAVNPVTAPAKVRVAVLDSGVTDVGQFALLSGADFTGTGSTLDDFVHPATGQAGHGTGVAGVVAAKPYLGVAYGSDILPVKTNNRTGRGDDVSVARGLCYAASRGARVLNVSQGTLLNSKVLELAAYDVSLSGAVIVASAGNTRGPNFTGGRYNLPNYPAAYSAVVPGLIAVGAVNASKETSDFATAHPYVDLVAPGEGVAALDPKGSVLAYDGTSFAAPFASGAVALMVTKNPGLAPEDYKQILLKSANASLCQSVNGGVCGAGMLDIGLALSITP